MHSTCNLEEHGLLLEKNTPGATAVRGEHETKLQFHQNWKMRTGPMNLSSYLSDGRGVGEKKHESTDSTCLYQCFKLVVVVV